MNAPADAGHRSGLSRQDGRLKMSKKPWTVWTRKGVWAFHTKAEAVVKFNELRAAGETPALAEPKVRQ